MNAVRTIKKYPNRRLYDTTESRYVTLEDIRKFVIDGLDFIVVEKSTNRDITRVLLLQVVAAEEEKGEISMSRGFLLQVIRSYGTTPARVMARYLEHSLDQLSAQCTDQTVIGRH
jgi:polyhydroxyalkanoate synthesis repressor PhaR